MGILSWIVFGLIAGFLASKLMGSGQGIVGNIVVGIIGALLGGWIMSYFNGASVSGFNLTSFLVAILGACSLIAILRLVTGRSVRSGSAA